MIRAKLDAASKAKLSSGWQLVPGTNSGSTHPMTHDKYLSGYSQAERNLVTGC